MNLLIRERLKSRLILLNGKVKSVTEPQMDSIYFDLYVTHADETTKTASLKIKFRNTNFN